MRRQEPGCELFSRFRNHEHRIITVAPLAPGADIVFDVRITRRLQCDRRAALNMSERNVYGGAQVDCVTDEQRSRNSWVLLR